ncbi:MAG: prepilin-type N-terminal cleavage/methylation domain-containing protein [Patescibacteria group bacterium]|jgi:prepilin-type N-terminal cleavage/methylation domain-containing protein
MKKGFTLIELLVVIGIIAILAGIVIVAVNPGRQLAQARDATRWNDVNALLSSVHQYAVDNLGNFPSGIDVDETTVQIVGTDTTTNCSTATPTCTNHGSPVTVFSAAASGCYVNLLPVLVSTYLPAIPQDGQTGSALTTRFYIDRNPTTGRITVGACDSEQSKIEVTR